MAAYSKVTGDYVVRMDDDGEHNPKDLFLLIDKLEEGYDYVCAKFNNYHHSLYKRLGSKFNYWFLPAYRFLYAGFLFCCLLPTEKESVKNC